MNEEGSIQLDNAVHCFCVSWFTIRVANVGATMAVDSWNQHHIPKVGIPDHLMSNNNRAAHIPALSLPTTEEAVMQYERTGGHLNITPQFGMDPYWQITWNEVLSEVKTLLNGIHNLIISFTL